jgi:hypothetical protein
MVWSSEIRGGFDEHDEHDGRLKIIHYPLEPLREAEKSHDN